ncbi:MAG: helix-turn-helix domain-containing protein [Candidatus Moraniibacteriota bacterium]
MNGFKIKKIQSLTLGEKMRRVRNEKRITLSEIAKNTKIQLEYLEKLENGDYNSLPADVYVRGFLKSFAEYVGVNEDYLIKSFIKERRIQNNIAGDKKKDNGSKQINLSKFSINPKILSIVFISLFFLGLLFYLYYNLNNFISNPELVILNPTNNSIIEESSVVIKGRTDIGNNLFINNQPVLVDEEGFFSENIILKEGVNIITVRSVNQFNKEAIESVSVEGRYNKPEEFQPTEENPESSQAESDSNEEGENESSIGSDDDNPETQETELQSEVLGVETVKEEKKDEKKKKD